MNKIKQYIVTHRSGCGLCPPELFDTYDECAAYIEDQLATLVLSYVYEEYGEDSDEYKEIEDLTNEDIVLWGEENDLVCSRCFTGYSDWEEFDYTSIEIPLTPKSDEKLSNKMSIIRNGYEIQLTENELMRAHFVYEHYKKVQYVTDLMNSSRYADEKWHQSLFDNHEFIEDVTYVWEVYNSLNYSYEEALAQAIEDEVNRRLYEMEEEL